MSLKQTIETEYKNALKSKDKGKISTYRLILSLDFNAFLYSASIVSFKDIILIYFKEKILQKKNCFFTIL